MSDYDGYAFMKTDDERFDARDLAILVHSSMDRQGYLLEGSKLRLACGGDEAFLQVSARRQNGEMETVRFPDHPAIEEAIAGTGAVGMVSVDLDQMFDDHRRSGSQRIEQASKSMGVPSAAFGLDGLPDDTSALEGIADALAHMAAHRIIPGPRQEDGRWICARYDEGHPYISLVGRDKSGDADRMIILDEKNRPTKDPELAEVARAMRASIGGGYGRSYDASSGRSDEVIVDAAIVFGRFEHPSAGQIEDGFGRLRAAVAIALGPRPADVAVENVVTPQPDRTGNSQAKPVSGASLQAMFGLAGRAR